MSRRYWVVITLALDTAVINLAYVSAFFARFGGEPPSFNFEAYLALIIPITIAHLAVFGIYELYNPERLDSRMELLSRVIAGATLGSLVIVFITFFLREFTFPRLVILLAWLFVVAFVAAGRVVSAEWFRIRWPARRILVVGDGADRAEVERELAKRSHWGYEVVAAEPSEAQELCEALPQAIDRVIITSPSKNRGLIDTLVESVGARVRIEVIPELYEIYMGRPDHTLLSDIPLIGITEGPVALWRLWSKRAFDVLLALLVVVISLPLIPLLAIVIRADSRGSIFYRQQRVGQGGRRFDVFKLRTMTSGAEDESGAVMADPGDSRVTRVGRFLRRSRLDELPQALNVLSGSMSFVGPRPERPEFVEGLLERVPGYDARLIVRPGITGLAQVSGGYGTDAERKLKYDLIYIRNLSLLLDLKILLHTLRVVLGGGGSR